MKKLYKITLLVPYTATVECADAQAAHNEATAIIQRTQVLPGDPSPIVHSIVCLDDKPGNVEDFPPSPAA